MTDPTTEVPICDWDREVYILGGLSNLTFDEVQTRVERYAIELQLDVVFPPRGSEAALSMMEVLRDALVKRANESNDIVVSDLSPQLIGLEGHTVRVTDHFGDTRTFTVERWTDSGLPPVHVEVTPERRLVAQREYEKVEVVK